MKHATESHPRTSSARAWMMVVGAVAGMVLSEAPAVRTAADDAAFALALLRRDGILVPFAEYNGNRWRAIWQVASGSAEAPIQFSDIPKGWWGRLGETLTWRILPATGPVSTVRVTRPAWFPLFCQQQVGVQTDYRASTPVPPPSVHPFPKDGLGYAGAASVSAIRILSPRDEEAREAVAAISEEMLDGEWGNPLRNKYRQREIRIGISPEISRKAAVTIEALYVAPGQDVGDRVFYFEASKTYPPPPGMVERAPGPRPPGAEKCYVRSYGSGWFYQKAGGKLENITSSVNTVGCEFSWNKVMLPLGVVRVNDRSVWVVQWAGWDYERYEIIEPREKTLDVLLERAGGWCSE